MWSVRRATVPATPDRLSAFAPWKSRSRGAQSWHVRFLKAGLTWVTAEWEISHMQKETTLVKADEKGRVCIRGTKEGQQYLVTAERGGWWVMPAPKVRTPPGELEALVADTWEKLGPAPDID